MNVLATGNNMSGDSMSFHNFGNNYTEVMRLDSSGNLRIGTTPFGVSNNAETSKVKKNNIVFCTNSGEPLLEMDETGFIVRGIRVPIDDKEAKTVYNAMHQWLTYATLTRNY